MAVLEDLIVSASQIKDLILKENPRSVDDFPNKTNAITVEVEANQKKEKLKVDYSFDPKTNLTHDLLLKKPTNLYLGELVLITEKETRTLKQIVSKRSTRFSLYSTKGVKKQVCKEVVLCEEALQEVTVSESW